MASYSCNIGNQRKFTFTATNELGAIVEPAVVAVWVRNPAGTKTTYVYGDESGKIIKTAEKKYQIVLDFDAAGFWYVGCYSTGTNTAASGDISVHVDASARS